MDGETQTQTEDLILRFRTAKALGLLMTTNSEESADRIELSVAAGRVRLAVRLGDRDKVRLSVIIFITVNKKCASLSDSPCWSKC